MLILSRSHVQNLTGGQSFGARSGRKSCCRFVHGVLNYMQVLPERVLQYPLSLAIREFVIVVVHILVFTDWLRWVAPLDPWLKLLTEGHRDNSQWVLSSLLLFFVLAKRIKVKEHNICTLTV